MGKTEEHKAIVGIYFVTFVGMCIKDATLFPCLVLFSPTQTNSNNQCETIPIYAIIADGLPPWAIKEIISICHQFLWTGNDGSI